MRHLARIINKHSIPKKKSLKGQGTIEFAIISILLFAFIFGIIEMARFLYTYSIVTNAAQEGSRYGIIRPRDVVLAGSEATQIAASMAARGTPTYIPQLVAPSSACDVTDKARAKAIGVDSGSVQITTWYDDGDGTPVPVTASNIDSVVKEGNRIVVEASYKFTFILPFLDKVAPNGITVKMVSARTILQNGTTQAPVCSFNSTPAPTLTAAPTGTATPTSPPTSTPFVTATPTRTATVATATSTATTAATLTPTNTPTNTPSPTGPLPSATNTPIGGVPTFTPTRTSSPTSTATATRTATASPTPRTLTITSVDVRTKNGNNKPVRIQANVSSGGVAVVGATVYAKVYINGTVYVDQVPLTGIAPGSYEECPAADVRNGDVVTVDVFASAYGYTSAQLLGTTAVRDNQFTCP